MISGAHFGAMHCVFNLIQVEHLGVLSDVRLQRTFLVRQSKQALLRDMYGRPADGLYDGFFGNLDVACTVLR